MRTLLALFFLFAGMAAPARHRHRPHAPGEPGKFDFYVLVLSWAPEFCYSHPAAAECREHRGFVVHGLWPQNADGTYPSNCQTNQRGPSNPSAIADIVPAEIVEHEWLVHGTCSGLSGDGYFALIRRLYESIHVPERLKQPSASFTLSAAELKNEFEKTNPSLRDEDMVVQLRGNYLNQVKICESKGTNPFPVACSGLPDARSGTFVVPPVR